MLKTLIVDDERLVRRELRQLVDWSEYQIEIVGEAENGHSALCFLSSHEVDLMITDLSMPGLSGIEFIKTVREQFPRVKIVVMTMYQDFGLIQQAMRLGAVDYITKTNIEKENFGSILHNILKRLANVPGEECCITDNISVFLELVPNAVSDHSEYRKLSEGVWLGPTKVNCIPQKDVLVLQFSGVFGLAYRQLSASVQKYIDTRLFYVYKPGNQVYFYHILEDPLPILKKRDEVASGLIARDWLLDETLYTEILEKIPTLQMTHDELTVFFYQPYLSCAAYLHLEPADYFSETGGLKWWYQWCAWLDRLRDRTAACLYPKDSPIYAVQKVIVYIGKHYMEDIKLTQLYRMAAMSKSQFSHMFKFKTGKTCVDYIKHLRVEHAKRLLIETDQPVLWVGEQVGYPNDRYFRKVFQECVKCTPAQYRSKNKQE